MDLSSEPAEVGLALATIRSALHEALIAAARIDDPTMPLRAIEGQLGLALHYVYRTIDARSEWQERTAHTATAVAHTREALVAVQAIASSDPGAQPPAAMEVARWAALALQLLTGTHLVIDGELDLPRGTEPESVATVGEPRLLAPARLPLVPVVPFPELEDPPDPEPEPAPLPAPITTLAELQARMGEDAARAEQDDEPESGAAPATKAARPLKDAIEIAAEAEASRFGHAIEHDLILGENIKGLVEDLAMFGLQRRPLPSAPWRELAQIDQRLLSRVDALVACGPTVYRRVVKQLEGRPVPDPELTWAVIYFLGSIRGQDTLEQLIDVIRLAPLEDELMARSVADALVHAPHPGIEPWLHGLLQVESAEWRELATRVLGRRGAVHVAVLQAALSDPDPRVVLAAAQSLGTAPGEIGPEVIEPLLSQPSADLFRAGVRASILRHFDNGAARCLDLTVSGKGSFGSAGIYVAITHDVGVAGLLRSAAEADCSAVMLAALGWFGHVEAMDFLVATLGREDAEPKVRTAAVVAMQRITGAGLTDDDPAPEHDEDELPFTKGWQPRELGDLSLDPAVWGAWWERWRTQAVIDRRYRRGLSWAPPENLREMQHALSDQPARRVAHLELVARTGLGLPFDQQLFVAAQLRQLEAWQRKLGSSPPGLWPTKLVRRR